MMYLAEVGKRNKGCAIVVEMALQKPGNRHWGGGLENTEKDKLDTKGRVYQHMDSKRENWVIARMSRGDCGKCYMNGGGVSPTHQRGVAVLRRAR